MSRAHGKADGRPGLRVSVTDGRGRPVADQGLGRWLARAAPPRTRGAIAIALVSDAAMKRLNATYRGTDRATDVLSFPSVAAGPGARSTPRRRPKPLFLGDLAIALGVARRQSRQEGHSLRSELRILALHGLLHLLGYDHETDSGTMRRVEDRLRRRAGLPAGLVARTLGDRQTAGSAR